MNPKAGSYQLQWKPHQEGLVLGPNEMRKISMMAESSQLSWRHFLDLVSF